MDHATALFMATLADIETRLTLKDPYEVLIISALLRKLLIDEHPLLNQVNSSYRIRVSFEILPPNDALVQSADFYILADGLDPETANRPAKSATLSRDQFLKAIVLARAGKRYTIRDLIKFEANIMGGVHAGSPRTEKEKALKEINSIYEIMDTRGSLVQLKAIARVVLKAVKPLRDRIIEEDRGT